MRGKSAVALLLIVLSAATLAVARGRTDESVYSVAQVQATLARHRAAWVGRTILVKGTVIAAAWRGPLPNPQGTAWCGAPAPCLTAAQPLGQAHLVLVDSPLLLANRLPPGNAAAPLWLHPGVALLLHMQPPAPNRLLALLRRLRGIGRLLPHGGQPVRWDVAAVYRVQILPAGTLCLFPRLCDDAVLLNALPPGS